MARFRNDFGEDRVVPTLGYILVPAGTVVPVPDDEWHHWQAGGWTPLDPDPRPAPAAEPEEAAAVPAPATVPPTPAAAAPAPAARTTAPDSTAAPAAVPADSEDVK